MGVPADWFGSVDRDLFRSLAHPIRGYRRWRLRRRLGPYAPDDDGPGKAHWDSPTTWCRPTGGERFRARHYLPAAW